MVFSATLFQLTMNQKWIHIGIVVINNLAIYNIQIRNYFHVLIECFNYVQKFSLYSETCLNSSLWTNFI